MPPNYGSAFSYFSSIPSNPVPPPQITHYNPYSISTANQLHAHALHNHSHLHSQFALHQPSGGNGHHHHVMGMQEFIEGPKKKEKEMGKKGGEGKVYRVMEESLRRKGEAYDMGDFVRDLVVGFGLEGIMGEEGKKDGEVDVKEGEKKEAAKEGEEEEVLEYINDEELLEMGLLI